MPANPQQQSEAIESELLKEDPCFAEIVIPFVEGLSDRLRKMQEQLRSGDFEGLRTLAHQLKGSGGGHGFPILSEKAAHLEQAARQSLLEECADDLDELRNVIGRITVPRDPG